MKYFLRNNGLTIVLSALFIGTLIGMISAGYSTYNQELSIHGSSPLSLIEYLQTGQFYSALFENWESEFLQMGVYVILTAYLFQKGSAESRDPDELEIDNQKKNSVSFIYAHSLGITLTLLFFVSLILHWFSSANAARTEAERHNSEILGYFQYLLDAQFWFESFQNWQSEFLSTAVLVVLSIFLREKNSPESKPINAPNNDTGA